MDKKEDNVVNSSSVVTTEVKLGEKSVRDILTAEVAKVMLKEPDVLNGIIEAVLFLRPPKQHSYDSEKPTFFESAVDAALKPMLKEAITKEAEKKKGKLTAIIAKAFKTEVVDNKEFEKRLIEKLGTFSQNISFYINAKE